MYIADLLEIYSKVTLNPLCPHRGCTPPSCSVHCEPLCCQQRKVRVSLLIWSLQLFRGLLLFRCSLEFYLNNLLTMLSIGLWQTYQNHRRKCPMCDLLLYFFTEYVCHQCTDMSMLISHFFFHSRVISSRSWMTLCFESCGTATCD